MQYSEKVMEHFANPRNAGVLETRRVGEVGQRRCGDIMKISLKIDDDETLEDIRFQTFGFAPPSPSADLHRMVKARTRRRLAISNDDVVRN